MQCRFLVLLMPWQDDTRVTMLAAERVLLVDWAPMVHVWVSSTLGKVRRVHEVLVSLLLTTSHTLGVASD